MKPGTPFSSPLSAEALAWLQRLAVGVWDNVLTMLACFYVLFVAIVLEDVIFRPEKLLLQDVADVFSANAGTVLLLMLVGMVAPAIPAVVSSDDRRKSGS